MGERGRREAISPVAEGVDQGQNNFLQPAQELPQCLDFTLLGALSAQFKAPLRSVVLVMNFRNTWAVLELRLGIVFALLALNLF